MKTIFKCRTHEGYVCKLLSELLASNVKTACFEIDNHGIVLRMMDNYGIILVNLKLNSDNFIYYKLTSNEKIFAGINLNHFNTILNSVKKKDSMCMFISKNNPGELGIKVIPRENLRVTTSYVQLQTIQNLYIELPTGYTNPTVLVSSEWQKTLKDLANLGTEVQIVADEHSLNFNANTNGIIKRQICYRNTTDFSDDDHDDHDDDTHDEQKTTSKSFSAIFTTDKLLRMIKLSGMGANLRLYTKHDLPLLIKTNVGTLGTIEVYLKSNEQIELDA